MINTVTEPHQHQEKSLLLHTACSPLEARTCMAQIDKNQMKANQDEAVIGDCVTTKPKLRKF